MSLTDTDILEQYRLARDTLVAAINAGESIVEYYVGSRRKRVSDPLAELQFVEKQIAYYRQATESAGATGRARNYAQFHRR